MTENEMIKFIRKSLPKLEVTDIQTNTAGWDNDILIVNQEIVFRFPKNKTVARNVQTEAKLLKALKKQGTVVNTPSYQVLYDEHNELVCVYYRYINGFSLGEIGANNLLNWNENAKILADFLSKLHRLNTQQTSSGLKSNHSYNYWYVLYQSVQKEVYPCLSKLQKHEINDTFSSFLDNYSALTFQKTVIHGDLTSSNILYNQNMITGIIDFTDAQIGDPAFDFAGFFWDIGPDFTKLVLSYYNGNESKESIYERVTSFYGLQPVFHELLYAFRNGNSIDSDKVLSKFLTLKKLF